MGDAAGTGNAPLPEHVQPNLQQFSCLRPPSDYMHGYKFFRTCISKREECNKVYTFTCMCYSAELVMYVCYCVNLGLFVLNKLCNHLFVTHVPDMYS